MRKTFFVSVLVAVLCFSCNSSGNKQQTSDSGTRDFANVDIPCFSADSAFAFVESQLAFGERIPNSAAHDRCAQYLVSKMTQWVDTVIVQDFSALRWDKTEISGRNIISVINPDAENRVLLAAHWDSRAYADNEQDPQNMHKPILGANDGASGVALLMEMARIMKDCKPACGIDIIFFDLEDQGTPSFEDNYREDSWCLGSQYWAKNPHKMFYQADYGILFDMVGGFNPRFTKEEVSRKFAPGITNEIWTVAQQLGYGKIFVDTPTDAILDDHLYVNQNTNIPMVDIVENQPDCSFFRYWHTLNDNLDAIDKNTMKIVADVVMTVIYGKK